MRVASSRGFTLIEMMVVIAVISLLMFAIGPEIGIWMRNTQIRNAADSLQSGLQAARADAMRRNAQVRFTLVSDLSSSCTKSATGTAWVVSMEDPTSTCNAGPSDVTAPRIVATRASSEGSRNVVVRALRSDGATAADEIVFDGFGRVVGTTGIARVDFDNSTSNDNYRALRVAIGAAGNVRRCDPRVSTSDDPRRC
jgi:type IV fimbrial biogenesis protein FimT